MNKKPSDVGGLFSCRRIVVVGANGAGKTWLARGIAKQFGLPIFHNDILKLTSNWQTRSPDDVRKARDQIAEGAAWVIDGGPSILAGTVLERAEVILWRSPPRSVRLRRIVWRSLRYIGRTRPEHPKGNADWPGKRQWRFIVKAWTGDLAMRQAVEDATRGCGIPVIVLKHDTDAARLLIRDAACQGAELFK